MKFDYKNWNWETVGSIELDKDIFEVPFNENAIANVVRWQMAKARSGNHETKTRSMVSGTNKKPWAQKETGKSRQGSLRSPHFRGGGVVFGPHKRDYSFKLNKKLRRLAAISAISAKVRSGGIEVVKRFEDFFCSDLKKTKEFVAWKNARKFNSILFVVGNDLEGDSFKSFSNVPYCNILPVRGLNVLSCIKHETIIFDVNSIEQVIQRYSLKKEIVKEEVSE